MFAKHNFKSESASALILTLVIMLVVSIFIATLFTTSIAETKIATTLESNVYAHYLGRSGVNLGLEKMRDVIKADNPGETDGYVGTDPAKDDIEEFKDMLNTWAAGISPVTVSSNESFTLSFELVGDRKIKIISTGIKQGNIVSNETVTLTVEMLPNLLTGGRADNWYNGNQVLDHKISPAGESYLGQGVLLEGKAKQATKLPSNSGSPIYRASVIQVQKEKDGLYCMVENGKSVDFTFDVELVFFGGIIENNDPSRNFYLTVSDAVAKNKIADNKSVLYIPDSTLRDTLTAENSNGVGFESLNYYKYFAKTNVVSVYNNYLPTFEANSNKRYGLVYFADYSSIPVNSSYTYPKSAGYYFFQSGIDINSDADLLNKLIPIHINDPILDVVYNIYKVTISGKPSLWEEN